MGRCLRYSQCFPPVVCTMIVSAEWCPAHIALCVCGFILFLFDFVLCCQFLWIVHSWLPLLFSLDCPFLIVPSAFSGLSILDCPFGFLWIVHSWLPLLFSLDCPFLIAPSVFTTVYFNNIPCILWRSDLLVEKTGLP